MIHDGVCCLSSDEFVGDDVSELIAYICQLSDFILFFSSYSMSLSVYCTFFILYK